MTEEMKVSVRNLIEFILRTGDLDNHFAGSGRALEGTRAHQYLNRELCSKYSDYKSEVKLKYIHKSPEFKVIIEGRADGIQEKSPPLIYEIKSTTQLLDEIDVNELHRAQAMVYAYIYAKERKLSELGICLIYFQLETAKTREFRQIYNLSELESFFTELLEKYLDWANFTRKCLKERNTSIDDLDFPYPIYRKGQRRLAVAVYRTIVEEKNLFVQAPTGIGKTISTLFPALKTLGEGHGEKIFYLTAKTVTRKLAEETLKVMIKKGLKLKAVTLTAKEKICFLNECSCNPEDCSYARGHFDRANQALWDILSQESIISREIVEDYAREHQICPFEFSLDLTHWVDCIIGDYNYVFDPVVSLKSVMFEGEGDYLFLIDEAHNLVERAREMYSAEIKMGDFLELKEYFPGNKTQIADSIYGIIDFFKMRRREISGETKVYEEEPEELARLILRFSSRAEEWLLRAEGKPAVYELLLEQYFNVLSFLKIYDLYGSNYSHYYHKTDLQSGDKIKLFCLDPSELLKANLMKGRSAIFFSATLTPLDYYREVSGGIKDDYLLELNAPFTKEQLCLLVAGNVSTRYRNRQQGYRDIVVYIKTVIENYSGNYLVFFPSYEYLNRVYELFITDYPKVNSLIQTPEMSEEERLKFLLNFEPEPGEALLGFAVLGGVFSEGIDLRGDRLSGVIVVGIGHPAICLERNLLRQYFQFKNGQGYEFAYLFPGMNKVLQAGGRTIRTENDRGIIILIGERFNSRSCQRLLPRYWQNVKKNVTNPGELEKHLKDFWQ
ncbi:MAG TPA: ATP-dependent DNA helicase [Halanaerobiales bacterium]|nr:ATP-dependent DNA helicase [Halanaerobiales bacterium]